MSSIRKASKLEAKSVSGQQQLLAEVQSLLKGIERAERTITDLKAELEFVNLKHAVRNTTQEDIDYLTALLKCAHKRLNWEKQVTAVKKRAPLVMESVTAMMQDPNHPPNEETCATLLNVLQQVKTAMERLERAA